MSNSEIHMKLSGMKPARDIDELGYRVWRHEMAHHLPEDKQALIIDIGCGTGKGLMALKGMGYRNTLGIDIDQPAVESCLSDGLNAATVDAPNTFLLNLDATYDCALMCDVLEHIPKRGVIPALEAACCALKRGGKLIVRGPNSSVFMRPAVQHFPHEWHPCPLSMRQVLVAAGFVDVRVYEAATAPVRALGVLRWMAWPVLRAIIQLVEMVALGYCSECVGTPMVVTAERSQ